MRKRVLMVFSNFAISSTLSRFKQRAQGLIEFYISAKGVIVNRAVYGGWFESLFDLDHLFGSFFNTRVESHRFTGQDGCPQGGGLFVGCRENRATDNVGLHLLPDAAARAAPQRSDLVYRHAQALDDLNISTHNEANRFHNGAREVTATVSQCKAVKNPAGFWVCLGSHRSLQVRQHDQPFTAGNDARGFQPH